MPSVWDETCHCYVKNTGTTERLSDRRSRGRCRLNRNVIVRATALRCLETGHLCHREARQRCWLTGDAALADCHATGSPEDVGGISQRFLVVFPLTIIKGRKRIEKPTESRYRRRPPEHPACHVYQRISNNRKKTIVGMLERIDASTAATEVRRMNAFFINFFGTKEPKFSVGNRIRRSLS